MKSRLLMVFLIDALGHRQTSESRAFAFMPFEDGPIASVCGFSSACIPSLLTGRLPDEHGHWNMFLRDPAGSVFRPFRSLMAVAGFLGRRRVARVLVKRALERRIQGYFSLYEVPLRLLAQFDLCEKRSPYAPGGLAPWRTPFDAAAERGLVWQGWDWRVAEAERRRAFTHAVDEGRADFLFYYTPLLDGIAHSRGTRSREALACQRDLAGFVEATIARARNVYGEVRTMVFGDHGMADVRTVHDLMTALAALPWRMPEDFLYFADATMIRVWYFRDGIRERVEALLHGSGCGRILDDDECRRLGVFFPDRRYGETIFLADAGRLLAPSFMGLTPLAAMHGYHPDDADGHTVLFSDFAHVPFRSILEIGPFLTAQIETWAGEAMPRAEQAEDPAVDPAPAPAGKGPRRMRMTSAGRSEAQP